MARCSRPSWSFTTASTIGSPTASNVSMPPRRSNGTRILADIRQGTRRDAILYSCGANAAHGLPRTNEDKRRAVRKLLEDTEWMFWSDVKIAEVACVSHDFVSRLREELHPASFGERRIRQAERGGTVYPIDTTNLGRKPRTAAAAWLPRARRAPALHANRGGDALDRPSPRCPADPRRSSRRRSALQRSRGNEGLTWWAKLAQLLQSKAERAS